MLSAGHKRFTEFYRIHVLHVLRKPLILLVIGIELQ